MRSENPFSGKSYWIWSSEGCNRAASDMSPSHYQVRRFRRTFQVEDNANIKLIVFVSADSRYKFFCNGKFVGRGPAKGDIKHHFYDRYDLGKYIVKGRNVLSALVMDYSSVKAHYSEFGPPMSVMTNAGGFILDGTVNCGGKDMEVLSTDDKWKVQIDKAYSFQSEDGLFHGLIGYFEDFDARLEPSGWTDTDFADDNWQNAKILYPGHTMDCPDGIVSSYRLLPRMIPMLQEDASQRFSSVCSCNQKDVDESWQDFIEHDTPVTIQPDQSIEVILDVGELTTAFPEIKIDGGKDAKIQLNYAEALRASWSTEDIKMIGQKVTLDSVSVVYADESLGWTFDRRGELMGWCDKYTLSGLPQTVESFHWRTFRFIRLKIQTAKEPLRLLSFKYKFTAYPFGQKADFESSAPEHSELWDISYRTFRLCSHETFEDCPYYEQLQYAGDTEMTSKIAMLTSGDYRLSKQALYHFFWSVFPEGITQSRYPSRDIQIIPSWSLHWITMVYDYLLYSGDADTVREFMPTVHSVLNWFRKYKDHTGLPSKLPYWNIVDWCPDWQRGVPPGADSGPTCIISSQYLFALQKIMWLEEQLKENYSNPSLEKECGQISNAINNLFWSDKEGLYFDRPGGPELSQYSNAWAVYTGIADTSKQEAISRRFPESETLSKASFFGLYYVMKALEVMDACNKIPELLKPWHTMADYGLSTWAEDTTFWRSLCHAWSAHPILLFINTILGINPVSPGCKTVNVRPQRLNLTRAKGTMMTPEGAFHVEWKIIGDSFELKIKCPKTIMVNVRMPNGKEFTFDNGIFEQTIVLP